MKRLSSVCVILFISIFCKAALNPSVTLIPREDAKTPLTDDKIRIPVTVINGISNTTLYTKPFTIGAWIRPDFDVLKSGDIDACILSANTIANGRAYTGGNTLLIDNATKCLKISGYSSLNIPENIGTTPIKNKEWQYVSMTFDPVSKKISGYLNGKKEVEISYTYYEWSKSNELESLYFMVGSVGFNGSVDDIHIASRILTDDEISLCVDNKADEVGLVGWYTLDNIIDGTLGQFANSITSSGINAEYVTFTLYNTTSYNYKKGTSAEAAPDMSSIDESNHRQVSSLLSLYLPDASDFEGVNSITFTDKDGRVLPAHTDLTIDMNDILTIDVVVQSGKLLKSITIGGNEVKNHESFRVDSNINIADFSLNIATLYSFDISVPEHMKYIVSVDGEAAENPECVAEGSEIVFTITNKNIFSNISAKLNDTELSSPTPGIFIFTMPSENAELMVSGVENPTVAVKMRDCVGGTYSVYCDGYEVLDGDLLLPGSIIEIQQHEEVGYYPLGVKVNGVIQDGYQVTVPSSDFYLYVDFRLDDDYNKALTFKENKSVSCTTEDVLRLPIAAVGMSDISSMFNAKFAAGMWIRQTYRASEGNMILLATLPTSYGNTNPYLFFNTSSDGEIQFGGSFGSTGTYPIYSLGKILPLDEWHYLAFNLDVPSRKVELFYDGKYVSSAEITYVPERTSASGLNLFAGGLTFNGAIDEIQLFNNTLTESEVAQLYEDKFDDLSSLNARFDFQSSSNNQGLFENLIPELSEYQATYLSATGSSVTNGVVIRDESEAKADISTITKYTQRLSASLSHDSQVTINTTGDGYIRMFTVDGDYRLLLDEGETVRNGQEIEIEAIPFGVYILNSLRINDSEISIPMADAESNTYLFSYVVNGPTNIDARFAINTTNIVDVENDNCGVIEYYSIGGVRVSATRLTPGVYIRKQGSKVEKILVKE